jgi:hypothetical protein
VFTGRAKRKSKKDVAEETAALELGLFGDAPTQPDPFSFSAAAAPQSEPKWSAEKKEEHPKSEDEAIGAFGLFDDEPVGGESWQSEAAGGLSLFDNESEAEYRPAAHASPDTSYFDSEFTYGA